MYLEKTFAGELKKLGFPQKSPEAGDVYAIDNQEWVIGGQLLPNPTILLPPHFKNGSWLPTAFDILTWVTTQTGSLQITYKKGFVSYFHILSKYQNKEIKTKGNSLHFALFKLAREIFLIKAHDACPGSRRVRSG